MGTLTVVIRMSLSPPLTLRSKHTDIDTRHTLIPPRGYVVCGVTGSRGQWLDSFGVIISR